MSSKSISNYRDFAVVILIIMTGLRTIEAARADVTDIGVDIYSPRESDIALKTRDWGCSASILMLRLVIIIYFRVIIYINSFAKCFIC